MNGFYVRLTMAEFAWLLWKSGRTNVKEIMKHYPSIEKDTVRVLLDMIGCLEDGKDFGFNTDEFNLSIDVKGNVEVIEPLARD